MLSFLQIPPPAEANPVFRPGSGSGRQWFDPGAFLEAVVNALTRAAEESGEANQPAEAGTGWTSDVPAAMLAPGVPLQTRFATRSLSKQSTSAAPGENGAPAQDAASKCWNTPRETVGGLLQKSQSAANEVAAMHVWPAPNGHSEPCAAVRASHARTVELPEDPESGAGPLTAIAQPNAGLLSRDHQARRSVETEPTAGRVPLFIAVDVVPRNCVPKAMPVEAQAVSVDEAGTLDPMAHDGGSDATPRQRATRRMASREFRVEASSAGWHADPDKTLPQPHPQSTEGFFPDAPPPDGSLSKNLQRSVPAIRASLIPAGSLGSIETGSKSIPAGFSSPPGPPTSSWTPAPSDAARIDAPQQRPHPVATDPPPAPSAAAQSQPGTAVGSEHWLTTAGAEQPPSSHTSMAQPRPSVNQLIPPHEFVFQNQPRYPIPMRDPEVFAIDILTPESGGNDGGPSLTEGSQVQQAHHASAKALPSAKPLAASSQEAIERKPPTAVQPEAPENFSQPSAVTMKVHARTDDRVTRQSSGTPAVDAAPGMASGATVPRDSNQENLPEPAPLEGQLRDVEPPPQLPGPRPLALLIEDSAESDRLTLVMSARRGEVHVSVRTADATLGQDLQRDLGQLVDRLEQAGYSSETILPTTEKAGDADRFSQPEDEESGRRRFQQQQEPGYKRRQQQQQDKEKQS